MVDTHNSRQHWFRTAADWMATIVLILASAAVVWSFLRSREPIEDRFSHGVSLDNVALLGSEDARVGFVEFSDFRSEDSARFAQGILPALVKKYVDTGKLGFGFKHLPRPEVHGASRVAAEMAACAYDRGFFWEVHSEFFRAPAPLTSMGFHERAVSVGLTKERMNRCLAEGRVDARMRGHELEVGIFGIQTSPTFLLGPIRDGMIRNVQKIVGLKSLREFERLIDEAMMLVYR